MTQEQSGIKAKLSSYSGGRSPGGNYFGNAGLPDLTVKELLLWLFKRRSRFRITGNSMLPLLKPNEEVLIDPKAYCHQPPQVGDLVVALHPQQAGLKIVKRIAQIGKEVSDPQETASNLQPVNPQDIDGARDGGDRYFLLGENLSESSDSRSFGWVDASLFQGKITSRFG